MSVGRGAVIANIVCNSAIQCNNYGEIYGKDYGEDYGEERYILKQSNKWRNFQLNDVFLAPERSKENTSASQRELN